MRDRCHARDPVSGNIRRFREAKFEEETGIPPATVKRLKLKVLNKHGKVLWRWLVIVIFIGQGDEVSKLVQWQFSFQGFLSRLSGWWFQIFLIFTPYFGKIPIFATIFKLGSNHQIVVGDSIRCGPLWTAYGSEVIQTWHLILCWAAALQRLVSLTSLIWEVWQEKGLKKIYKLHQFLTFFWDRVKLAIKLVAHSSRSVRKTSKFHSWEKAASQVLSTPRLDGVSKNCASTIVALGGMNMKDSRRWGAGEHLAVAPSGTLRWCTSSLKSDFPFFRTTVKAHPCRLQ